MKIIQYTVSHTVFILNAQMIKQIDAIQSMIFLTIKMTFFSYFGYFGILNLNFGCYLRRNVSFCSRL